MPGDLRKWHGQQHSYNSVQLGRCRYNCNDFGSVYLLLGDFFDILQQIDTFRKNTLTEWKPLGMLHPGYTLWTAAVKACQRYISKMSFCNCPNSQPQVQNGSDLSFQRSFLQHMQWSSNVSHARAWSARTAPHLAKLPRTSYVVLNKSYPPSRNKDKVSMELRH